MAGGGGSGGTWKVPVTTTTIVNAPENSLHRTAKDKIPRQRVKIPTLRIPRGLLDWSMMLLRILPVSRGGTSTRPSRWSRYFGVLRTVLTKLLTSD
jgi:hypothetical protein